MMTERNYMKGKAYGVGVGPGDPELMTLKAARLIRENEVIAVPGKVAEESVAYKIASGSVPDTAISCSRARISASMRRWGSKTLSKVSSTVSSPVSSPCWAR